MKPIIEAAYKGAIIIIVLASVILLWEHSLILTLLFIGISLLIVRGKQDVLLYALMVITTAFFEPAVVNFSQAWMYGNPDYLGVPFWIPFGWGILGVAIKDIVFAIEHIHR